MAADHDDSSRNMVTCLYSPPSHTVVSTCLVVETLQHPRNVISTGFHLGSHHVRLSVQHTYLQE